MDGWMDGLEIRRLIQVTVQKATDYVASYDSFDHSPFKFVEPSYTFDTEDKTRYKPTLLQLEIKNVSDSRICYLLWYICNAPPEA